VLGSRGDCRWQSHERDLRRRGTHHICEGGGSGGEGGVENGVESGVG